MSAFEVFDRERWRDHQRQSRRRGAEVTHRQHRRETPRSTLGQCATAAEIAAEYGLDATELGAHTLRERMALERELRHRWLGRSAS